MTLDLALAAFLAAGPTAARPDVFFEQHVTTSVDGRAGRTMISRVYWSGRRIRLESGDLFEPRVLLVDLARDKAYHLQESARAALVVDLVRLRSQAHLGFSAAGDRMGAGDEDAVRVESLPGRRRVAGYPCEGHRIRSGGTRLDVWVAREVPLDTTLFTEFLEWSGADQSLGGFLPAVRRLRGFPLETRSRVVSGRTVYETEASIVTLKIEPIEPELFEIPEGYAIEEEPEEPFEP